MQTKNSNSTAAPMSGPAMAGSLVQSAPDAPDEAVAGLQPPRAPEAPFVKAKFDGLVLVCGQCEKRGSGPSKLTAKETRKTLKGALGVQRARLRIVQSSCLGLCPKKSIAIAAAGQGSPSLLAEARNARDLKAVAMRLGAPSGG